VTEGAVLLKGEGERAGRSLIGVPQRERGVDLLGGENSEKKSMQFSLLPSWDVPPEMQRLLERIAITKVSVGTSSKALSAHL
ncbi:MAG: hypothetical protein RL417_781, partial [Pseudomonadota bacterium]